MPEKIRVAVLGLVHDHIWDTLKKFPDLKNVEVVAAADPHEDLLARFTERTGAKKTYTDAAELLDKEDVQAALVYASNRGTGALVEMAAARGLHVMSEKPMASDLDIADRMLVACRMAGVGLVTVSLRKSIIEL